MEQITETTTIEELAGIVSAALEAAGIYAVLSGGAVVSIYTNNEYDVGTLRLLTPTQCVMDRLAAYFHWNDLQSLDQALMVASSHPVNLSRLEEWAKREGANEKLETFKKRLGAKRRAR